jgi:maltooligosyltrehalose trehalohydrolase
MTGPVVDVPGDDGRRDEEDDLGPVRGFHPPADRPWLWAPEARAVQLQLGEPPARHLACRREGQHWIAAEPVPTGQRYRFVVDGTAVPDPRSRAQPDGVHGASEWVGRVDRTDTGSSAGTAPLARSVTYELHVGTFSESGTFSGAVEHLDHLVQLGVTHVELMPVAAFDGGHGWGYDGVDLFAPHPAYGTEAELRMLVDQCHLRGLSVLMDVVLNHLGPAGNHLGVSGPYFTDRYRTPWGDALNLDGPGADGVRRFLLDAATHWLEDVDVDGLRLDAVHELFDTSAVHLLEQLAVEVARIARRTGRPRVLIAESDRSDPRIVSPAPSGPGLDAMWSDDLHHCLHVALTGERDGYYEDVRDGDLAVALTVAQLHQGRWSPHRRRSVGRSSDGISSERFVVALQNHDQVGNRARGERLHHLVGVDRTAAAAALTTLSPFSLLMFQGEEWAASAPFPYFSDHGGELGEAVRRGRRAEFAAFGWPEEQVLDPQDPATFATAALRWDELDTEPHRQVLDWYRALLHLRATHPCLAPVPLPGPHLVEHRKGVVAAHRGTLTILANLSADPTRWEGSPSGAVVLERHGSQLDGGGVELEPGAVVVLDRS